MQRESPIIDVSADHQLNADDLPIFISRQVTRAQRYYFNLSTAADAGLRIALGGWERVRPDYGIYDRSLPYFSIELVADGRGQMTLNDKQYELRPGVMFAYSPGCQLTMQASSPETMLKYYVTFIGRRADRLLASMGLSPCGVVRVAPLEVREIFDLMQGYGMSQSRLSEQLCTSLLPTLRHKIVEQMVGDAMTDTPSLETYRRLRKLIDRDFLSLKSIAEAAARCGLSDAYASRLFQRFDHITPYQYLIRHKMKHAADLLSHGEMRVTEVADCVGFEDRYQFSRAFKRVLGICPAHFRRQFGRPFVLTNR
jgi:AraC-like DNA-binding protein